MSSDEHLKSSNVFCMLPWVHTHILPSSKILPCCVWPYSAPIGDVSTNSLKEIWNNEDYKKLRLNMLEGKANTNCSHCYEVESVKSESFRQAMNQRFSHLYDSIIPLTGVDGYLEKINLAYFDVRFSNVCNFKCRGCSPELSSSWYSDYEQMFGKYSERDKYINVSPNPDLWKELTGLIDTIQVAYFAGGEPLMMEDHYRVLDELITHKKTDVFLDYNSNLSKLSFKNKNICDYWNQFSQVQVGVSLDDFGKRGEYFRHGMKWEETLKNIQYVKDHCPHVVLTVNCTINAMNVLYVKEFHQKLIEEKIIQPHQFQLNLMVNPIELRVQVLPKELKQIAEDKIRSYVQEIEKKDWGWYATDRNINILNSIIEYMNQQDLSHLLPQFIYRTKKLDSLRNESFADTFPEMAKFIKLD